MVKTQQILGHNSPLVNPPRAPFLSGGVINGYQALDFTEYDFQFWRIEGYDISIRLMFVMRSVCQIGEMRRIVVTKDKTAIRALVVIGVRFLVLSSPPDEQFAKMQT